ncbi:hypothetical protein Lesp02_47040 [Lentzea sp. NBRC 105346]|uniref:DUF6228 family protein n=1 Tax=Lentzea sp. NBRC 105346 TaxID=3032205 RepID=UPI0024A221B0|nr:DUF6228 family protein [Lentzea sp. NBRC 105346]GLZ32516.1 hypothetical protein Lesp02_47040 [Lentzea sp. NBRC 105346]
MKIGTAPWIRLFDATYDGYVSSFSVEIGFEHGTVLASMGHVVDLGDLSGFLSGLAEDFTGWDDTRTWHAAYRDVQLDAVFRSLGHVDLTWTMRSAEWSDCRWSASVTVTLDAGEDMRTLASDVRHVLHPD